MRTRNAKLAGWLGLVGALAALNYASRFSSGKPPPDTLYRYNTAISGVIFYAITLATRALDRPRTLAGGARVAAGRVHGRGHSGSHSSC